MQGYGNRRATMRDVAARSGVSLKTVSRVVNGESPVSDEVRTRVQAAVEELGYRHNLAASNLRRKAGRATAVGALLQDVGDDFSARVLRALEDGLRERQVAILVASLDEQPERERALVDDLISRRVDGLVLMPATDDQSYLAPDVDAGLPTVFVDRAPNGVAADSVTVDDDAGGYEATRHLLERGHRRIAVLSDLATIRSAGLRLAGARRAFEERGLALDDRLVRTGVRTVLGAEEVVRGMLGTADAPTAVVTLRDTLGIGVVRALRVHGLEGRVATVGFGDVPLADLLGLTVVRQDVAGIGALAAGLLLARFDGSTSEPQHRVVPHTLVERGSGEIPAPV